MFGYRDVSLILIKIIRTAICKWRKAGVPSFINIYEGNNEEAVVAADMVKKDLD